MAQKKPALNKAGIKNTQTIYISAKIDDKSVLEDE